MNEENNQQKNKLIQIKLCKCCGNYEFVYRFIRCHLKHDALMEIMRGLYDYELKLENEVKYRPFQFKLSGIALITILYTDYKDFKTELENAIISEQHFSNNINSLIEKYDLTLDSKE